MTETGNTIAFLFIAEYTCTKVKRVFWLFYDVLWIYIQQPTELFMRCMMFYIIICLVNDSHKTQLYYN